MGVHIGGPHDQKCSSLRSILGSFGFGKLPYMYIYIYIYIHRQFQASHVDSAGSLRVRAENEIEHHIRNETDTGFYSGNRNPLGGPWVTRH